MGNQSDKQSYALINNPINCENDALTENDTPTKTSNKSSETLLTDVIKSKNISDTFKNYDDKAILDLYYSDAIIDEFRKTMITHYN